jgi:hypothetical protein
MAPLDPRLDFEDDGGTPAWRANQATWGSRARVIDVSTPPRTLRDWWKSLKPMQIIGLGVLAGLSPIAVFVVGFLLLILWDLVGRL